MKGICVFAGSSAGERGVYSAAADALGREIARRDRFLVYGGGATGLMGVLADSVLGAGGSVTGIIPGPLVDRELAHSAVRLEVVGSMHERKARMSELAGAFVALPGGLGTLEELMEIWTWAQLGIHAKPCGVLNVDGFYDHLLAMIDWMVDQGFVRSVNRRMMVVESDPVKLLDRLETHVPPKVPRWLDPRQT